MPMASRWPVWSRALQILEPGEDIKFSDPADVGGSYAEFLRMQFRAVAAAMGITYEQLTGDLTGVNYSSIRAGMLEFRRRCEVQHGVLVHQLCRPVWAAWMKQAVLAGALDAPASRVAASASPPVPRGEVDSAGLAVGRSRRNSRRCCWPSARA
jgi:lambda family phage portal protein